VFEHKYLTMRLTPASNGLELHPKWSGDCLEPSDCICTDGCSYCSGGCSDCTATCRGESSTGAILVDKEGEVEFVLNLAVLQKVIAIAERSEKQERAE
jgi:hypothetical protein